MLYIIWVPVLWGTELKLQDILASLHVNITNLVQQSCLLSQFQVHPLLHNIFAVENDIKQVKMILLAVHCAWRFFSLLAPSHFVKLQQRPCAFQCFEHIELMFSKIIVTDLQCKSSLKIRRKNKNMEIMPV